jgi:phospholipase/carboxylesterase
VSVPGGDPHGGEPVAHAGVALEKAGGVVVLLHGRGASAEDILGLAQAFYDPRLAYLAPRAAGHTWYPQSFLAPREQNEPWLSSALKKIEQTVGLAVAAGVPVERIVLCGFSQGACLATEFVATRPARYGGLIAYTGGLIGPPEAFRLEAELPYAGELEGMPAFFGSGDPDPHVPWERVEQSAQVLRQMGAAVATERYVGRPHTVSAQEIGIGRGLVMGMLAG